MNAANKSVRSRTAVEPINAIIILLKLESERYNRYRNEAWEWKEAHGKRLAENAETIQFQLMMITQIGLTAQ